MGKRWTPGMLKDMETMLKSGLSYREVARRMGGISNRTLAVHFPGYGKPARKPHNRPQFFISDEDRATIERIGKEGGSISDAVRATGVSRDSVRANYPQFVYTPEQTAYLTNAIKQMRGT